jgi:uncharacterized OB-fold protein
MSFEVFGIVAHTKESKAEEFVTYLEQGRLMGTRCKGCGTPYFPPQVDCPRCLASEVDWFEITGSGTLITYSLVHYGPAGFEDRTPYIVALADFGEGIKIFAVLSSDIDEHGIKPGMLLRAVPVRLSGNRISYELKATQ